MASNNVISGTDYLAIATYYSSARAANIGSVDYLYDAVYKIVLSTQFFPTIDLINEYWTSYKINADIYRSPSTYLSAVRAINNHVVNRAGTTSGGESITNVNEYLVDENITVPMGWAELCKATGTLVCLTRISNPPSPTTVGGVTASRFADGTAIPTDCT